MYSHVNSIRDHPNLQPGQSRGNMAKNSGFSRAFLTVVVAIYLFHFQSIPSVSAESHIHCPSSSCGKILEIKFPFRLKGDPEGCGDSRYELVCEDNHNLTMLTLSLSSAEFHVLSINYNNYTIRLVDPAIQLQRRDSNFGCASIPRYNLYPRNFSFYYHKNVSYSLYQYLQDGHRHYWFQNDINRMVVLWYCPRPVIDGLPADTTLCSESDGTNSKQFVYASTGEKNYWKYGCQLKRVTLTSMNITSDVWRNISYRTIGDALAFGFELSWLDGFCDFYCGLYYFLGDDFNSSSGLPCHSRERKPRFCISDYYISSVAWSMVRILPLDFLVRLFSGIVILTILLVCRRRRKHLSAYENIETFLSHGNNLMPIRYSYREIKKMTRGFKDRLGEGGYGFVYKGKLRSGTFVAIKMLTKSKANGQDFINEVATIGRIHHVNVVQLIGFCVEGSKRALVYDFMPNGSLDKHIFSKEGKSGDLDCDVMFSISLGVARGIMYLHQGCDMQILHFDIKPHNILLDDNFVPKISDFGLARLYAIDDSIVSVTARGTLGYMAPELYYKNIGGVSYKADVYSFGMLLMEMASRRKNLNVVTENLSGNNLSQIYFPTWIHDQFSAGRVVEIEDIAREEEKNLVTKMIMVALWCIQMNPRERPSMKKVVEMLEGELERIEMPPRPSLYPEGRPPATVSMSNQDQSSDPSEDVTEISSETTSTALLL